MIISCSPTVVQSLTWLYDPGLGPQVGQVHIGFPAIYNGVGVLAGSVSRGPVCHGHLQETKHFPMTTWRYFPIIFDHNGQMANFFFSFESSKSLASPDNV